MDLHDASGRDDRITTERLVLRRLRESDRADVMRLAGDLAVSRWLAVVPHPYTDADFDTFLQIAAEDPYLWMILREGALVGAVSGGDEMGYWLAPNAWGQGLMAEAGREVIARSFADPARQSIRADYHLGNTGSRRVLEKLGFRDAGPTTSTCYALGQDAVPARTMVLTRDVWMAQDG